MKSGCVLGLALAGLLLATPARAGLIVSFDENGNGLVMNTSTGAQAALQSLGNIADPVDPNNGLKPLVYDLTGNPLVGLIPTAGDINVEESVGTLVVLSDLVRFTPNGLLVVYSDAEAGEPGDKADVGLPIARQTNVVNILETGPEDGLNGLFPYTPSEANPGFLPIPPGPTSYFFTSDAVTPEPSSLVLIASGLVFVGLVRARWRRLG